MLLHFGLEHRIRVSKRAVEERVVSAGPPSPCGIDVNSHGSDSIADPQRKHNQRIWIRVCVKP